MILGRDFLRAQMLLDGHRQVRFFFQAEDGIRDKLVTGVQTCALPISHIRMVTPPRQTPVSMKSPGTPFVSTSSTQNWTLSRHLKPTIVCIGSRTALTKSSQIGRASCRERVEVRGVTDDVERE